MSEAATAILEGSGSFGPLSLPDRLRFGVGSQRVTNCVQANEDLQEVGAIAAVKRGEAEAYDYLVSKYMRRVVSIAWGLLRNSDDAEDLAQEAFVKAYENIGRFRSEQPFGPWIYRIVTNLGLDVLKHRKRFRHEELSEAEPPARRDRADLPAMSGELASR